MTSAPQAPPRWMGWVATWFGCGYAPKAPGTVGSLGAVPLFALLTWGSFGSTAGCANGAYPYCWGVAYWGVVACLGLLGTWCADRVARAAAASDPQHIVIDEVVGVLIALGAARCSHPAALLVAWLLFRLFDIWKPWPLSAAEHAKPIGLGIMLDDVLAGALAGGLTLLAFSQLLG
ncbi:MAG TPA: phosphatidylglycerophosphatase A [Polyangiaceae bacterium]|nr:phosphatidylglycerophosphatase A [Polyangiaceae bacterium]